MYRFEILTEMQLLSGGLISKYILKHQLFQDIRSFFQLKKTPKPSKPAIEDDDDVIPESPDVQIIKNKVSIKTICLFLNV